MKPEAIASDRTLFCILIGLSDGLLAMSIVTLWFIDPRRFSGFTDAAGVTSMFSVVALLVLWWLLRRGAPRLGSICLGSALAGVVCTLFLPVVP
jgi:uncharacterized protein (TIGR03382 family)